MTATIMLWGTILVAAALALIGMLYLIRLGVRTRTTSLRAEPPAPETGLFLRPVLITVRGLNEPRT